MNRKTKIVATIGPATSSKEQLKQLILRGVNVCRLNFSHGKHEDHKKVVELVRELDEELETHTALMADLQGPKLRVGMMKENSELKEGETFKLVNREILGTNKEAYMNYGQLPTDVKPGEQILLDDGKLRLEVVKSNEVDEVETKVLVGGVLSSNKGVNLPNTLISLPSLTEKDEADLDSALELGVDWIGLSFVRSARDIIELKSIIKKEHSLARVVAKIEKPQAIENIDDIIMVADAVMVARGDLGVEIPMQQVPVLQKQIVQKCMAHAKPVIIATQMMETMIDNPVPTRAEVSDVGNAVMDGVDAVMLSGETSVGKHPLKVIDCIVKIIEEVEEGYEALYHHERIPEKNQERFITDSICFNACRLANRVDAKGIITMTHSGYTAFKISSQRPLAPIFVFSGNKFLLSMMNMVWGVECFYYDKMVSTDHTIADIKYMLKKDRHVKDGDIILNTASIPIEEKGSTNMLKLSYI
ncbi:MAG: pyruvate kinase [Crocinitomicaceae bacterium]|mgnify:CR=1 FL=1|jgi:pyruvate kinase|nr:pyruvate kinase [Crocinitomicaceae bacterium]